MPNNFKNGQIAEQKISARLIKKGWEICRKNYRNIGFEIDIIAKKPSELLIAEVKYRSKVDHRVFNPHELVDQNKKNASCEAPYTI